MQHTKHNIIKHATGWVCPDHSIIDCAHASVPTRCLIQHHPQLAGHQQALSTSEFLDLVYQAGYYQVGRYQHQVMFEHGVNNRPDQQLMQQWCQHITHQGQAIKCVTSLYRPDQHDTPVRRRFFRDP